MAQQPLPELAAEAKLDELTRREREVLELIARGLSNRRSPPSFSSRSPPSDARETDPDEAPAPRPRPDRDLRLRDGRQPTRSPLNGVVASVASHRHGKHVHSHAHAGRHRHLRFGLRESEPVSERVAPRGGRRHSHDHALAHSHAHGHSHGLVDRSIVRSREGVRAVALSLAILGLTAVAQLAILFVSNSVALLADLVHNFGDALTAVPLGIAFFLRSFRGEKLAGLAVVLAIFISACVALYETVQRFLHPEDLTHLWVLAAAGVIGFAGNELAAQVRLRAGRRLSSPALLQTATMLGPMASSPSGSSRARSSSPSEPRSAIPSSASSSRS